MSNKNKRLGKGIEALFTSNTDLSFDDMVDTMVNEIEDIDGYQTLLIEIERLRVNPFQPRKNFEQGPLLELSESIKEHGIIQPLVVRKSDFGYDILAGERRFRAAKLAGLTSVPAVVKSFNDAEMMELAILENIQREDLNVLEEAAGYQLLMEKFNWTQQVLAKRMGKSRSHITNTLRLQTLPKKIQDLLIQRKLTMGHTKPLVGLDEDRAIELAEIIVASELSVREAEKLVNTYKTKKPAKIKEQEVVDVELEHIEERLVHFFGSKVSLGRKKIVIDYANTEELNRILEKIGMIE
jgi:ParB-like partition proteins